MIILEFDGLPGSGKTTVTKELVQCLQEQDIEVVTLDWQRKQMTRVSSFAFGTSFITLLPLLISVINCQGSWFQKLRYIKSIILTYAVYKNMEFQGVLVMEQGILQDIISIPLTYRFKNERLQKMISQRALNSNNVIHVHTCLDIEESSMRLSHRIDKPSRLDVMYDLKQRKRILENIDSNLNILREVCKNSIYLDMRETPQANVEKVMRICFCEKNEIEN